MSITERTRNGATTFEASVAGSSRTFPTKAGAQAWNAAELAKVRNERVNRRAKPAAKPETVATWARTWLPRSGIGPASMRSYDAMLRNHLLPALGEKLLTEVLPLHLADLYGTLYRTRSHATVTQVKKVAHCLFKAAVAQQLLMINPADAAKVPTRRDVPDDVEFWTPPQMQAFLAQPKTRASAIFSVIVVAAETAMRRGEVLGLTPADLHLDGARPYLMIRRNLREDRSVGVPKTKGSRRRVSLTPDAAMVLAEQRSERTRTQRPTKAPQLFLGADGRPLSPNQVSKAFAVLAEAFSQSPEGRELDAEPISFHGLRHSWAANHLAAGVPMSTVSKQLGHASVSFTVERYGHVAPEVADALPGLYRRTA